MDLLVTGGRGFLGRHVVAEAIRRGHAVRVLARPGGNGSPPPETAGADVVEHDLRNRKGLEEAVAGVEAVIHCAAAMGGSRDEQEAVTVDGTTNLLSAMAGAGARRVILVSTLAVYDYGAIPRGSTLDEDSSLEDDFDARSAYARAKRKQEDLVRTGAEKRGWRWTVLRPGVIYGPGRTWHYHLGMRPTAKRWLCLAGGASFPVTYVENCAEAIVLALDSTAAAGATLNLVDDGLPTRRRYLQVLARHTGRQPTILNLPWGILHPAARVATGVNRWLFLNRAPIPDLLRTARLQARCKPLAYSNERAKTTLRWTPRYDFEEGMERSCAAGDAQAG